MAWSGYRRRIRIVPAAGVVRVGMEDDFHRFGLVLHHDGTRVARVETAEPRHPWTTCPAAGRHLRERMAGVALADAAHVADQRQHCTHLYDLFVLAVRHAGAEGPTGYDIRVGDREPDGTRLAEIARDGVPMLRWRIDGSGRDEPGGGPEALARWSRSLPETMQEAARMLRRGVLVSGGRDIDWPPGTPGTAAPIVGACFTFQPANARIARRIADTVRDFSDRPDALLNDGRG